jgi:hypothetical protein
MEDFIFSIKTKRVWYKPWTWRRRELIDAYWPLTERVDTTTHAVNPMILPEGREIEMPRPDIPPHNWDDE